MSSRWFMTLSRSLPLLLNGTPPPPVWLFYWLKWSGFATSHLQETINHMSSTDLLVCEIFQVGYGGAYAWQQRQYHSGRGFLAACFNSGADLWCGGAKEQAQNSTVSFVTQALLAYWALHTETAAFPSQGRDVVRN